ncbi:hypothetical protein AG1IA_09870 [Rhizoctonia solani AG-1 IA]|uniref:Uncharacterized protein n=1 Tax=Thanatephorus cucumeris (strain AG1-IA) TaxID=983506 RepID=L8WDR8_THACA|nr:hypothetical protein AG1IA_09870 [Rhizoctonia solani AG-1 IA]
MRAQWVSGKVNLVHPFSKGKVVQGYKRSRHLIKVPEHLIEHNAESVQCVILLKGESVQCNTVCQFSKWSLLAGEEKMSSEVSNLTLAQRVYCMSNHCGDQGNRQFQSSGRLSHNSAPHSQRRIIFSTASLARGLKFRPLGGRPGSLFSCFIKLPSLFESTLEIPNLFNIHSPRYFSPCA